MSADLPDAQARRRIREDLDATFVVEAAAGTGKTSALVSRVLAVVQSGRGRLREVVAVTFTEKAAGEMKLRLRAEIERARNDASTSDVERTRLEDALRDLETARIGTIHSLCADVLHERPLEAGLDPMFEVAAQDEADALFEAAFDVWFERVVSDPPPGVARVLRRRREASGEPGPREELLLAGRKLCDFPDFDAPWRIEPFDRASAVGDLVERLRRLGHLATRADRLDDWLAQNLAEIARFVRELDHREKVRDRDIDGLEAELRELSRHRSFRWRGGARRYGEGLPRELVLAERDEAKARLLAFVERADAHLAALLRSELRDVVTAYRELKARGGKLDFLDLLLHTRDLVRDRLDVRRDLAARFGHIFVDEQQDTDPLQAEILLLLASDDPTERDWTRVRPRVGRLFLVGDPKQSIYRFRRADVALYEATKRRLLDRGAELLHLTTSFRATPSLQSLVNASFAPVMHRTDEGTQPDYVPLRAVRADPAAQPSIVALPVPRPYGERGVTAKAIDESLPAAVAAFVDWLVNESGWTVTERDQHTRVPVEARHVCLLFKRFTAYRGDTTREYVRGLEARRIPHVLVGGRSFHDREEVVAIRNVLSAAEWPDDELAVFAALRGPFLALSDDELLVFRHQHGPLHPLRRIDPNELDEATKPTYEALSLLRSLHVGRNRRPIAETLERFLTETRAHAGIAIWPTGEQALANVLRVLDLARRFEAAGATSFRAFVEKLERDAERGEASDAPVVEEGTEGVRIMTVHRAKGLELPVVVLCDPTAPRSRDRPSRWVDPERRLWVEPLAGCLPVELAEHAHEVRQQDEAEAIRVAYVAATRARDLLVVPVVGDERTEGWFDVLHPGIYPPRRARRDAEAAAGCPLFGDDSVLERTGRTDNTTEDSVAPGRHRAERGEHDVVFWDPAVLKIDRAAEPGLRQERLLVADEEGKLEGAGHDAWVEWTKRKHDALTRSRVPSFVARSTTWLAHPELDERRDDTVRPPLPPPVSVAIEEVATDKTGRAHGKRFGTLVHEVLAQIDLDADEGAVRDVVALVARTIGAPPDESADAEKTVIGALSHPLVRRASEASRLGGLRRETPVALVLEDATLAEGIVDLAFREQHASGARWHVVDFKTDLARETYLEAYGRQVSIYARAIEAATGEPCDAHLLFV